MTNQNTEFESHMGEMESQISANEGAATATFAAFLFEAALSEDVLKFTSSELADTAKAALSAMSARSEKETVLQFDDLTAHNLTAVTMVNEDMPFLIDSLLPELRKLGHEVELLVHPIYAVQRDKDGKLTGTPVPFHPDEEGGTKESLIHFHLPTLDNEAREALRATVSSLMNEVRLVVSDWRSMMAAVMNTITDYKTAPPPVEVQQVAEAVQFLQWLVDGNFTFLGIRFYSFDEANEAGMTADPGSGLGVLKDPNVQVLRRGKELVAMSPEVREFMMKPDPLIITKANVKARVHRPVHMDYVGVKRYDQSGKLIGELRVVGLFTSSVYAKSIREIPYIRHKAGQVTRLSGYAPDSHSGKALLNVLESYPRDELFQIDAETLSGFARAILALDGRAKLRVLARSDKFNRFVSVLVYVPRNRYTTDTRIAIGDYLAKTYNGRVSAHYPGFPEGELARVHFIIGRDGDEAPAVTQKDLEDAVEAIITTWEDGFDNAVGISDKGAAAYRSAFTAAYKEAYAPTTALSDVSFCQKLQSTEALGLNFYSRADDGSAARVGLKFFHLETPIELSNRVPLLENLGFKVINERTYAIHPTGDECRYLHDMTLESATGEAVDLQGAKARLEASIQAVWNDLADDGPLNALVLNAGLDWRQVALLRTIARYLQQAGIAYTQIYIGRALNAHASIAKLLVELFSARFDPEINDKEAKQSDISAQIDEALTDVSSLAEDTIIRRFRAIIMGSIRTNFYQQNADGSYKTVTSLKLAPREIAGLPEPRPFREIFLSGPRVEGLHLRFGKVARGGLRWSDRAEDFRTEVLGLVKAQQVKNAVIVPVGSKGGFVPKKLTSSMSRDEFITEGTEAYKLFISSLLDITDNLDGETVLHPDNVVRHEEDDPYLVVAADKGTATFSDTANGISQDHDFWLDDAFASGGSAGYDHKKMGITARGAWEAVKRHFREMDKDIQTEPFTAAGVGDMSGDVFGNGMLLSPATKLVAAFDHRDIFIDPDPDHVKTYEERKRLFDMGRSSWQDYDKSLLSQGGMIYSRSEKSLSLTPEIQRLLGVLDETMTPFELMQAIMKMEVELFWFGGIGTYIRGPLENDADVGDRANDPIRIEADEVRAKVIGEGANLGVTQRGRIALGKRGVRLNSDAVDNSAGVNSSDVEVNIKIALQAAIRADKLDTPKRNILLESMTDEVAELCLRNNYLQTLSISLTERTGFDDFGFQQRFMQALEEQNLLDREVEDLPNDAVMEERLADNVPLTRSEIGVILAYAKLTLFDELLESDVPDAPYLEGELFGYFPQAMQETYADEIRGHRLRREIVATRVANAMINRGGATYLQQLGEQTGADSLEMARAYVAVRDAYGLQEINGAIDALDTKVGGDVQLELYQVLRDLLLSRSVWFLRNVDFGKGLEAAIKPYREGIEALRSAPREVLPPYLRETAEERSQRYQSKGVPEELADQIAFLPVFIMVPTIILIANRTKRPLDKVTKTYFDVAGTFLIGKIDDMARGVEASDYFDQLALERARETLAMAHRKLTLDVLEEGGLDAWIEGQEAHVERTQELINSILEAEPLNVSKISVAANAVGDLVRD